MTTRFEFHLIGAEAPEGELEADRLLAIISSLKEIAIRIGRAATDAEVLGRAPDRTRGVARLTIGLTKGSTTVTAHRAGIPGALDFDSDQEAEFDRRFAAVVEACGHGQRPEWVNDSLATATGHLISALERAAPEVEFAVDGRVVSAFTTADVRRDVWQVQVPPAGDDVQFIGRLFAVNLNTHRLQVQDDVGNEVALPNVPDDAVSALLGRSVRVVGIAAYDAQGRLSRINDAAVAPFDGSSLTESIPEPISTADLIAGASAMEPWGLDLTEEESDSFWSAMER